MRKTRIEHAFKWVCEKCYKANYFTPMKTLITPENLNELMEKTGYELDDIEDEIGGELNDHVANGHIYVESYDGTVICENCKTEFEIQDPYEE